MKLKPGFHMACTCEGVYSRALGPHRANDKSDPTTTMQKFPYITIDWLIEHGITSAPTQYRLYGRQSRSLINFCICSIRITRNLTMFPIQTHITSSSISYFSPPLPSLQLLQQSFSFLTHYWDMLLLRIGSLLRLHSQYDCTRSHDNI